MFSAMIILKNDYGEAMIYCPNHDRVGILHAITRLFYGGESMNLQADMSPILKEIIQRYLPGKVVNERELCDYRYMVDLVKKSISVYKVIYHSSDHPSAARESEDVLICDVTLHSYDAMWLFPYIDAFPG